MNRYNSQSISQVIDTMTEIQKEALYYLVGCAISNSITPSSTNLKNGYIDVSVRIRL